MFAEREGGGRIMTAIKSNCATKYSNGFDLSGFAMILGQFYEAIRVGRNCYLFKIMVV